MRMASKQAFWAPSLPEGASGPIYRVIVDLMAADIAAGRLQGGEMLPPQRGLARSLGVDFTTVTRAYNEARRRGLIESTVGRGTFVRALAPAAARGNDIGYAAFVDTSMNLPPQPEAAALSRHLSEGLEILRQRPDFLSLLTYRQSGGGDASRAAGAAWLQPLLPGIGPDRVLVCAGAQAALAALMTTYLRPGDRMLTEALTFPGFRALAGQIGVRLEGIAMDEEGVLPEALEAACRRGDRPKALYCIPTIHNPTTATMSVPRRHAIAAIARRHELLVFEDDAYGLLPATSLPPLATFLPESSFHVSSLSKTLAPALRVAYVAVPGPGQSMRVSGAIRAISGMAPPLMLAIVNQWIGDGTAQAILEAIRAESAARQRIAAKILPEGSFAAHPQGHHLWLGLPPAWRGAAFAAQIRESGITAVPGEAFSVDDALVNAGQASHSVRIALGAVGNRDILRDALRLAVDALGQSPAVLSNIV